jgi:hypothetical protein
MYIRNLFYTAVLLLISLLSYSQDMIVKRDSTKIFCKITKEDSTHIYYSQYKNNKVSMGTISKTEVQNFYISKSIAGAISPKKKDTNNIEKKIRFLFSGFIASANPVGYFSKKNINDTTSGFAQRGLAINVSVTIKLLSYFGINLGYFYQTNNFNDKIIAQNLQSQYGGVFTSTSTPYIINGFLGGLYFTIPIKKIENLYVDINILAGAPNFTSPTISITQSPSNISITQSSADVSAFAMKIGLGFRYKITKYLSLGVGLDYFFARPYFIGVNVASTGSNSNSFEANMTQDIKTFNLHGGFIFTLKGVKLKIAH